MIVLYIENALSAGMFAVTKKRAPEQILHLHVYYIYNSCVSAAAGRDFVEKFIQDYLEKIPDDVGFAARVSNNQYGNIL